MPIKKHQILWVKGNTRKGNTDNIQIVVCYGVILSRNIAKFALDLINGWLRI